MTTDTPTALAPPPAITTTFLTCVAVFQPLQVRTLDDGRIELRVNADTVLHLSSASAAALHDALSGLIGEGAL